MLETRNLAGRHAGDERHKPHLPNIRGMLLRSGSSCVPDAVTSPQHAGQSTRQGAKAAKKVRKQRKDATISPAVSGAAAPNASDHVARILAAWAQIPADVRERLLTSSRVPQGTVVG
jgi:hypothetical protein